METFNEQKFEQYVSESKKIKRLLSAGVPDRYLDKLPKFDRDDGNSLAADLANRFVNGEVNGILFCGQPGTGKTLLACGIIHRTEMSAKYVNVAKLLATLRATFDGPSEGVLKKIEALIRVELLVMDDLGAEKVTDWVKEVLYLIINGRYEKEKKLIVTTNVDLNKLSDTLGDRIVSRLAEMCELAEIRSDDRRITKWKT